MSGKVIQTTRTYVYVLTLLIFPNISFCQMFPYFNGALFEKVNEWKEMRERFLNFHDKMKGMTSLSAYSYVTSNYENIKSTANIYYDLEIEKAKKEYEVTTWNSNPAIQKDKRLVVNRYTIYTHKLNKIERQRKKDLEALEQQYFRLVRNYSPYWSGNDQNSTK